MIRGTTQQFKFKLPYKAADVEKFVVVFTQPDNTRASEYGPLPIRKESVITSDEDPYEVSVTLLESETLRFSADHKAYVQLRGKTKVEGQIFASMPEPISVYPCLYEEQLS